LIIGGTALPVALTAFFIWRAWAAPMGDFDTVHPVPKTTGIISEIAPGKQVENHTCGYHALASIYRSYGLDPAERRLRPRLGVDTTANVYDSESTGTLHPDMLRVLVQDGFECRSLDLASDVSRQRLHRHLDAGRYALALIKRRETGRMHWVVLIGRREQRLIVCDSLKPQTYEEPLDDYWKNCLLSVVLVVPSSARQDQTVWRLHFRGALEMWRAYRRM
jgi:ABC-type bacteriocin/lantibiotic exporter with double-glycine peptidase domain